MLSPEHTRDIENQGTTQAQDKAGQGTSEANLTELPRAMLRPCPEFFQRQLEDESPGSGSSFRTVCCLGWGGVGLALYESHRGESRDDVPVSDICIGGKLGSHPRVGDRVAWR